MHTGEIHLVGSLDREHVPQLEPCRAPAGPQAIFLGRREAKGACRQVNAHSWPARGLQGLPAAPVAAETCWGHGPSAVPARTSPAAINHLGRREAVFCRVISPQQSQVNLDLWFKSVPAAVSLGHCMSLAVGHRAGAARRQHCPLPGPPFTARQLGSSLGSLHDFGHRKSVKGCLLCLIRLLLQEVTGSEGEA